MSMLLSPGRRIDCGAATPHVLWHASLGAPGYDLVTGRRYGQRHGSYLIRTRVRDIGIVGDCDQSTGEAAGAGIGGYGNFGGVIGCSLFWVGAITGSSGYNTVFSRRNSTTVSNDYYGGGFALSFSGNLPRIWIHTTGAIEQVTSTIPITYGRLATIVVEVVSDGVVFYVNGRREKVATSAPPLATMGVASVISAGVWVGASGNDYDGHRYARHIGAGIFTGYLPDRVKLDGRALFAPRDDMLWLPASSGAVDATAPGATLTGSASLSAGSATGETNASAAGATLTGSSSIEPGSASGSGAAPGADLTGSATLSAGSASGEGNAAAPGATLSGDASISGGSATGESNATAPGAALDGSASISTGGASGSGSATAPGASLTGSASMSAGSASGEANATAPGATLTGEASIAGGAATGQVNAAAPGANLTGAASLTAGLASGEGAIILVVDPDYYLPHRPRDFTLAHTPRDFTLTHTPRSFVL
jgi:hypothetical protein